MTTFSLRPDHRAVIRSEKAENVSLIDIHRRMTAVDKDVGVNTSTGLRWAVRARNEDLCFLHMRNVRIHTCNYHLE